MELTAEKVDELMRLAMFEEDELKELVGDPDLPETAPEGWREETERRIFEKAEAGEVLIVEGIVSRVVMRPTVTQMREGVAELLDQLPDNFRMSSGGGWSFLNMCMTRDDVQWTSFHRDQESLALLGIACGLGKWLLPREMWSVLPAGMPYYVILDRDRAGVSADADG